MTGVGPVSAVDRALADPGGVVRSGLFAEFRGHTYPAQRADGGGMWLEMDRQTAAERFPGQATESSHWGHVEVAVPSEALDRYFARDITADWKGKYPVSVQALDGDRAYFFMIAAAHEGRELGLTGDQYSGWHGSCPVSELTRLEQEIREIPLP